ncbi:general substrate transporter [Ilyonectria robusta]|uniref:general substrate transporter n=1 Tax=Ilyonectria robusta TaxID=1079257 RepID=UPI001E8D77C4|nr:general substrate transporter [Ilyonectria robusta]KAH8706228.1 general substrate transporter [Ilyonectria robusta]
MAGQGLRQYLNDVSPYLILLIAVSTLGSLQFGYHLGELNAPQDVITCHKKSISALLRIREMVSSSHPSDKSSGLLSECIPMTEAAFATVSSIFTLGGLFGALCAGPFSSSRGRLLAMRATAVLYLVGAAVETIAGSVFLMALGRLVSGVGAGASTVVVPLYISEIAPLNARGLFGAMTQISINVGILIAQTLGYFWSYGSAWRWILGVGVCVATAQAVGLFVVPESPSWLAANGEVTAAKRTLQRIRGSGHDISEETETWNSVEHGNSEEEGLLHADPMADPVEPVIAKSPAHLGFIDVVKDPLTRPAIIAVVGIMFVQQFCGINSIIMYSVSLLADLLPVSSALLTILISVVNLVTTVACSPLPDRLGRKTCLLMSVIGQGSSALALALSIVFGFKILSAVAVLFFVGFYAVGLGPVPFILASELVGQEAVGATQSWCLGANYVASFLVAQFFPIINKALNNLLGGHGGWVYFIFAGMAGLSVMFVSVNVPESKGKRDADEVWGRTRRAD